MNTDTKVLVHGEHYCLVDANTEAKLLGHAKVELKMSGVVFCLTVPALYEHPSVKLADFRVGVNTDLSHLFETGLGAHNPTPLSSTNILFYCAKMTTYEVPLYLVDASGGPEAFLSSFVPPANLDFGNVPFSRRNRTEFPVCARTFPIFREDVPYEELASWHGWSLRKYVAPANSIVCYGIVHDDSCHITSQFIELPDGRIGNTGYLLSSFDAECFGYDLRIDQFKSVAIRVPVRPSVLSENPIGLRLLIEAGEVQLNDLLTIGD